MYMYCFLVYVFIFDYVVIWINDFFIFVLVSCVIIEWEYWSNVVGWGNKFIY